jgi:hypothetical protein
MTTIYCRLDPSIWKGGGNIVEWEKGGFLRLWKGWNGLRRTIAGVRA